MMTNENITVSKAELSVHTNMASVARDTRTVIRDSTTRNEEHHAVTLEIMAGVDLVADSPVTTRTRRMARARTHRMAIMAKVGRRTITMGITAGATRIGMSRTGTTITTIRAALAAANRAGRSRHDILEPT